MTAPGKERTVTSEQVWVALARCYRVLGLQVEHSLRDSGMSLTDFMLMEALLHKGPLTITQVQDAALLATGSMTVAVDRLEARGWLVRRSSQNDRRARVLELTSVGVDTIRPVYEKHRDQIASWMNVLSQQERSTLFASLRRIEKRCTNAPLAT